METFDTKVEILKMDCSEGWWMWRSLPETGFFPWTRNTISMVLGPESLPPEFQLKQVLDRLPHSLLVLGLNAGFQQGLHVGRRLELAVNQARENAAPNGLENNRSSLRC